jgi:hypothetical protein
MVNGIASPREARDDRLGNIRRVLDKKQAHPNPTRPGSLTRIAFPMHTAKQAKREDAR